VTTTNPSALVVAVSIDGSTMRVEDLPLAVVDKIAKQTDVPWYQVVAQPLADLLVARLVIEAVCAHLSLTVPEGLTPRTITAIFTAVPDDVPDDVPEDEPDDPFESGGNATPTSG
jgi:hypothetical protein